MSKKKEYIIVLGDNSTRTKFLTWFSDMDVLECKTDADVIKHLNGKKKANNLIIDTTKMKEHSKVFDVQKSIEHYKNLVVILIRLEEENDEVVINQYKEYSSDCKYFAISKKISSKGYIYELLQGNKDKTSI